MTESKNEYEFRAEIKKLLNILSKSLYKHEEIFLRELVSNAVDALKKIKFILLTNRDIVTPDEELKIEIILNSDENTITIRDTGIGMKKEDLINELGTIAGSGTEKFVAHLQKLKEEGKEEVDLDIIGQFGIGFYSVFMVADKVEVKTKSYKKDEPAHDWISDGTGKFTISPIDKEDRGTEVIIYMNEDKKDFINQYRIESIIKKYSNFVSFPIYVTEVKKEEEKEETETEDETEGVKEPQAVNQTEPLWRKQKNDITDEDYKNFYHYIASRYDDYLHVINYNVDGQVRFRSLMYIPETASLDFFQPDLEYGLSLYSKNVMIMKNCEDLFPKWMRFVKGVLESEDIPLNISRETIQADRKILKMGDLLTKKFLRELKDMAKDDKEKYDKFWSAFGDLIKEGIVTDPIRQKRLKELLRFKTSKTKDDEIIGLDDYLERMKERQEKIYYLVGENMESLKMSPHLGYYEKNDLEVILLDQHIDNFLMMNMQDYTKTVGEGDDKEVKIYQFTPIDVAEKKETEKKEGEEKKEEKEAGVPEDIKKFLERVKEILGEKIIEASMSERLYGSPCRLANPAEGPTSSQQRAMRFWMHNKAGDRFEIPKKILEFNPENPLIKELVQLNNDDPKNNKIDPVVNQLFENCLLTEGDLPDPTSMVPRINKILEMLITGKESAEKKEE